MNTITEHRTHTLTRVRFVSPWLRTRVWLTRQSLDQRIAQGESLASPELSHRAKKLASMRCRRSLAAGLRRVIADAEGKPLTLSSAVPLQRGSILRARAELERMAADLDAHEPVKLEGIARVQLLLTDGASPLYSPLPQGALDEAVAQAHAALLLA